MAETVISNRKVSEAKEASKVALEPKTFKVTGMTCNACVNSVERSLSSMPGVSATVNCAVSAAKFRFR